MGQQETRKHPNTLKEFNRYNNKEQLLMTSGATSECKLSQFALIKQQQQQQQQQSEISEPITQQQRLFEQ